ncbi:non-homologous end-joining factor 1-like [Centroberyx affinis]|uniref:non-homologous end-joining factor 1-like n=1 Tax=Centroberyx affinis TaxID=166261 RepID=UPI003A5C50E2
MGRRRPLPWAQAVIEPQAFRASLPATGQLRWAEPRAGRGECGVPQRDHETVRQCSDTEHSSGSSPSAREHALPQVCSGQQEGLGFDAELQDLYRTIVAHGNTNTRKRKLSERRSSEENRPATAEEPELAPSPGEAAVSSEAGEGDREQSRNGPRDTAGAKMAAGTAEQQSLPVAADPAERPAPRPKKKKAAGLFR